MHKLFERLSSMLLSDDKANWSSSRFQMVFTVVVSNLCLWFVFVFLCIKQGAMIDVPQGVLAIYGIANGIAAGAYVVQKKLSENSKDEGQ